MNNMVGLYPSNQLALIGSISGEHTRSQHALNKIRDITEHHAVALGGTLLSCKWFDLYAL